LAKPRLDGNFRFFGKCVPAALNISENVPAFLMFSELKQ
jgi:hypothetical protein